MPGLGQGPRYGTLNPPALCYKGRNCRNNGGNIDVRTFGARIQPAGGLPHSAARHVRRSRLPPDEQGGPPAGPLSGTGGARVMRPVANAAAPRTVGPARARIRRGPSPLRGPAGLKPFPPRAAITERDGLGALCPTAKQAAHGHPGRGRNPNPVPDPLHGRIGPDDRPADDDWHALSHRSSAAPSGDGFTIASSGAS